MRIYLTYLERHSHVDRPLIIAPVAHHSDEEAREYGSFLSEECDAIHIRSLEINPNVTHIYIAMHAVSAYGERPNWEIPLDEVHVFFDMQYAWRFLQKWYHQQELDAVRYGTPLSFDKVTQILSVEIPQTAAHML